MTSDSGKGWTSPADYARTDGTCSSSVRTHCPQVRLWGLHCAPAAYLSDFGIGQFIWGKCPGPICQRHQQLQSASNGQEQINTARCCSHAPISMKNCNMSFCHGTVCYCRQHMECHLASAPASKCYVPYPNFPARPADADMGDQANNKSAFQYSNVQAIAVGVGAGSPPTGAAAQYIQYPLTQRGLHVHSFEVQPVATSKLPPPRMG